MGAEGGFESPRTSLVSRRLKERVFGWQKLFFQNWALFKASRIGVVGLAIMIAFVLLALAAPFMGLRDPIRWTAPDEDLITVQVWWTKESSFAGSELRDAPPVTQPVVYRILPVTAGEPLADRIYVTMESRLYALETRPALQGQNAWVDTPVIRRYFNVSAVDTVQRVISVPPVLMNYGSFISNVPDYEIHLGTDDGYVVFLRDTGTAVPPVDSPRIKLDPLGPPVTGLASFNGDGDATSVIQGQANHILWNGVQWVVDRFTGAGDVGEYASLALNATDGVHIAYYDVLVGVPRNATLDRGTWKDSGVEDDRGSISRGQYSSLAVGADGRPRLAYYDEGVGALKFAAWNETARAWDPETVDFGDNDVGQYASLALDGNTPHIAYYDATNGSLKHATKPGASWVTSIVDGDGNGTLDVGRHASLAMNAAGEPRIAYYDATNGGLKVATSSGGVWTNVTVDAGDVGQYADLAVDALGSMYVAYYDATNGDLLFTSWSGAWAPPQVVDGAAGDDVGRYASIALGASGPAIAYENVTGLDLKYARWNASTLRFDNETASSTGHIGMYNSLAFDSAGVAHIASYSFSTGRTESDLVVAGTASGGVYAIDVGIPGSITRSSRGKQVETWDYRVRWRVDLGSEVHVAGGPLRATGSVPRFSPAFTSDGSVVMIGTANGTLHALRTSDGSSFWTDGTGGPRSFRIGAPWATSPVVAAASEGPLDQKEIVYAASSHIDYDGDMTTESLLFAIDATTGQPVPEWRDFADFQAFGPGGAPVSPYLTRGDLDEGDLSQPTEDGGTIYFGSTSGTFYAYRRDRSGEAEPGSVKWTYRDTSLLGLEPKFTTAPILDRNIERVLVTANHNNGTADPSDDRGVLYSLKIGTAIDETAFAWKKTFPAAIPGAPVSWKAPQSLGIRSVWIGYGGPDLTGVAALDSAGQFLAPSPPSWVRAYPSGNQYWLGLDSQGRDIFSQVIWGSRIALLVGFLSAFFTVVLGVIVGLIAGYAGGKTEAILMRFTDVILVLPGLPLIITLSAVLGASIWNIILVISLLGWPGIARIIRAEVLSLKERPFIDSARVTGASATRIVFKHIAPNVMPLAFLYMTFSVSGAILTEAALSFIGLGDINTMSWGIMLQLVSQSKALTAWWWLLPPGLAITLISLAFFLVGRAFDEIVNPRLRKR